MEKLQVKIESDGTEEGTRVLVMIKGEVRGQILCERIEFAAGLDSGVKARITVAQPKVDVISEDVGAIDKNGRLLRKVVVIEIDSDASGEDGP
jgi:hypothetical protein